MKSDRSEKCETLPSARKARRSGIRRARLYIVLPLLAAAVGLLADAGDVASRIGNWASPQKEAPASTTGKRVYIPWKSPLDYPEVLRDDLQVSERFSGTCHPPGESLSSRNPVAARCFSDSRVETTAVPSTLARFMSSGDRQDDESGAAYVFDPCWPSANGSIAVCPSTPWQDDVSLIEISRPTGRPFADDSRFLLDQPWAVELANGERCVTLHGAGPPTVGGLVLRYSCERGLASEEIDRTRPLWRLYYVRQGDEGADPVAIIRAWY